MISAGFSIAYSDLMTLAGLMRIFAPENMPSGQGHGVGVEVGITIVRDRRVPAGMVEVRYEDGRRERMTLPMERPRPLGASA